MVSEARRARRRAFAFGDVVAVTMEKRPSW
jgi:hypothetical protein